MLHPVCFPNIFKTNPIVTDINKLQRKMFTACIEYLEKNKPSLNHKFVNSLYYLI